MTEISMITDADLDAIEARARAATQEQWQTWPDEQYWAGDVRVGWFDEGDFNEVCSFVTDRNDAANATHIAGMDPSKTLALVAELRASRAREKAAIEVLRPFLFGDPAMEKILWGDLPDDRRGTMTTNLMMGDLRHARKLLADYDAAWLAKGGGDA